MSYRSYESSSGSSLFPLVIAMLAINLSLLAINNDNATERRHADQLQEQLLEMPGVNGVEDLRAEDDGGTFTFSTHNNAGAAQDCEGNYEVQDDVARVVGGLSCELTAEN